MELLALEFLESSSSSDEDDLFFLSKNRGKIPKVVDYIRDVVDNFDEKEVVVRQRHPYF